MIALIGLIVGVILGVIFSPEVPTWMDAYLPVAVIAGLDAVSGAVRSMLDGNFSDKVFVVSFLGNVAVACILVWLGDQLGVGAQMSTGVVVVLAMRIFANAAAIRRKVFKA
ncbi:MAG: small basic family protein [Candidatus Nanopelagicales bacterium]|nr:small basic family protein [Actinomycetota bacterium]